MASRFSPTVLPQAPSLSIFEDELRATRARPTTLQRIGGALSAFNEAGRFFSERDVRRKVLDEQDQGEGDNFGVALGRAATASLDKRRAGTAVRGEPGIPTRLGSFDSGSGRFLRPDDNVKVQQAEEASGLGQAGRGLEAAPPPINEADEAIRKHQRVFGDTGDIVAQRAENKKLAMAISALQRAGASETEIDLLRTGAIEADDVLSRVTERETAQIAEGRNRDAFRQLNQSDPVKYPEFLAGFDYEKEVAAETDDLRAGDLEDRRQRGRLALEQLRQQGRLKLKTDKDGNQTIKMPAGEARKFVETTFFTEVDKDGFAIPPAGFERPLTRLRTALIQGTATQQDIDFMFTAIDDRSRAQADRATENLPESSILQPRLDELTGRDQRVQPTTRDRVGSQPPSETTSTPDVAPPTMSPQRRSQIIAALQEVMAENPNANPVQILLEAGFPESEIRELLQQ